MLDVSDEIIRVKFGSVGSVATLIVIFKIFLSII